MEQLDGTRPGVLLQQASPRSEMIATDRSSNAPCRFARLLVLSSLCALELSSSSAVHAQANSPTSPRRPTPRKSGPPATATPTVRELFRQYCAKRHGADGTGSQTGSG
jgi:hypothetical protein